MALYSTNDFRTWVSARYSQISFFYNANLGRILNFTPNRSNCYVVLGEGLDDPQFITVVTTTTASVFGFWFLVGRYLFPSNGKNKEQ